MMYEYSATLIKIVDGDTVDVLIDLGFNTTKKERVRLLGIDTPESATKDLPEKKLGIRIEDNYWIVDQTTPVCLSEALPKSVKEIEEMVQQSFEVDQQ